MIMTSTLNPYINFKNNAREAMVFYKAVFGGDYTVMTFGEAGIPNMPADGVMHTQLNVDGKPLVMGSEANGDQHEFGGMSISLSGIDADELRGYFTKLSDGGIVMQPLIKASWGDEFGMLRDKFGITWMFNIGSTGMG
jgi:PhnB protein